MLENPLKSVSDYVSTVAVYGGVCVSKKQADLVSMLMSTMVLLGSFKITLVSVLFLMRVSPSAVYAMLRRGVLPVKKLFWGGLKLSFEVFKIQGVSVLIDDTERERSKNCRSLPFVRKTICKATGGWIQAQNMVFIVLATDKVTIPIWFCFHRPAKLSKEQKKICKKNSKKTKIFDRKYRTKVDLACIGIFIVSRMLKRIKRETNLEFSLRLVSADNGFSSSQVQQAVDKHLNCQFISKANPRQNIFHKRKQRTLEDWFVNIKSVSKEIYLRGSKTKIEFKSARVEVSAYGRKVHVVALRYDEKSSWQYIFATDLTWARESIIQSYSLRWLVEVFFEDWKQYDGWGVGALQRNVEGAARGSYLSLLTDLFLLHYQRTKPSLQEHVRSELYSAGTVIRLLHVEAIHQAIEDVLKHENPRKKLEEIHAKMIEIVDRRISSKHGVRWEDQGLQSSPSLTKRWGRPNEEEPVHQKSLKRA